MYIEKGAEPAKGYSSLCNLIDDQQDKNKQKPVQEWDYDSIKDMMHIDRDIGHLSSLLWSVGRVIGSRRLTDYAMIFGSSQIDAEDMRYAKQLVSQMEEKGYSPDLGYRLVKALRENTAAAIKNARQQGNYEECERLESYISSTQAFFDTVMAYVRATERGNSEQIVNIVEKSANNANKTE